MLLDFKIKDKTQKTTPSNSDAFLVEIASGEYRFIEWQSLGFVKALTGAAVDNIKTFDNFLIKDVWRFTK